MSSGGALTVERQLRDQRRCVSSLRLLTYVVGLD